MTHVPPGSEIFFPIMTEGNFLASVSVFCRFLRNHSTNLAQILTKKLKRSNTHIKVIFRYQTVVSCNGTLRAQYHILTLRRMFKSTFSGYRVDKFGACNHWLSTNYDNIKYPLKLQDISNFWKKFPSIMIGKKSRGQPLPSSGVKF